MRLWHKDLIPVLPKQQLLGQWRECYCIAKNIAEKGTPNHILVNKIVDYPIDHFVRYCIGIKEEMTKRGYICNDDKLFQYLKGHYHYMPMRETFPDWHNDRYLKQCYYNLQEKFDCGGISEEEWNKIEGRM